MPPKKPSAKTVEKQKQKVLEDKTFGMKNKNKSKTVQKYIKGVEQTLDNRAKKIRGDDKDKKPSKKEIEQQKLAELNTIIKVVQPKVPVGVDPKSVLCAAFKAGQCMKGDKCKYSHNLEVHRKAEKIDLYTDIRDQGGDGAKDGAQAPAPKKPKDSMAGWDEEQLEQVVAHKSNERRAKFDKVCNKFLEAIEKRTYGWFWECPNGGDKCPYLHRLPPGYVFKKKEKDPDEEDEEPVPLEELLEEERAKLKGGTPVTLETFKKWKEDKKKRKEEEAKVMEAKRLAEIKSGKATLSGREMFVYNPDVFVDDEEAAAADDYVRPEGEEEYVSDDEQNNRDNENGGGEGEEGGENGEQGQLAEAIQKDLFVEDPDLDIPDEDDDDGDDDTGTTTTTTTTS